MSMCHYVSLPTYGKEYSLTDWLPLTDNSLPATCCIYTSLSRKFSRNRGSVGSASGLVFERPSVQFSQGEKKTWILELYNRFTQMIFYFLFEKIENFFLLSFANFLRTLLTYSTYLHSCISDKFLKNTLPTNFSQIPFLHFLLTDNWELHKKIRGSVIVMVRDFNELMSRNDTATTNEPFVAGY